MKIKITADSSSGLEYAPFSHHIVLTPTKIHFGDDEYIDGIDIKADDFYKKLEQTKEIPTTSAPNIGSYIETLKTFKNEGITHVIHFPISSRLSNYSQNLKQVVDSYHLGIEFYIFDGKTACLMQGVIAKYAEILADKGLDISQIMIECKKLSNQIHSYFLVDDLNYLIKNGRLNRISGTVGVLAKIKPILTLNQEGIILPYEKIRTYDKALKRMQGILLNDAKKYRNRMLIVLHTNRKIEALRFKDQVIGKEIFNYDCITQVTPTVGAHIGSGVLAVACIGLDNLIENIVDYIKE